ncbi:MAG: MarR family winged helix-turn-helix transcriptional regulator [Nocardioidaceae bacterium]
MAQLTEDEYRVLLIFRCALRQYIRWSGEQAGKLGLTAQQHQMLLAVRAHPGSIAPSISELAEYLLIRHHSAVELANRAEASGLVNRHSDTDDQRVVRVTLTEKGTDLIEQLADAHMSELQRVAEQLHISQEFIENLSREFSTQLVEDVNTLDETG